MAHILIIDDEESIRLTFEIFLTEKGHLVSTAGGFQEALPKLSDTSIDLIFADVALSDGSGTDILREVRERKLNCSVIIITGFPDVESATEAVRFGAFDYLVKPVTQERLLHITDVALKNKALAEEKERYRSNLEAIFRSVNDSIITVDRDGSVVEINDAAMRMCGFSRDIIGQVFADLPKGCSGQCVRVLNEAISRKELVEEYRMECRPRGLARYVINLTACPLVRANNVFAGVVMVFKDETRLACLEDELAERQKCQRIIGKSAKMRKIYDLIDSLSNVDTTVLITGESGTGKELVAEAIHCQGIRKDKPLVKVNCSALPEALLESELFGHVKGSFTGASHDKVGRFQKAHGGTIFLDEIGDLSHNIQLDLLRVLQEKEFERVGDSTPVKVDARIVTATNKDLKEKVKQGTFREDLYFRLKVVEINLPPLRERREDIPLLTAHFLVKFAKTFKKDIVAVSSDVQQAFMTYPWPGNVRELEHAMEHAFVMCRHDIITIEDLPPEVCSFGSPRNYESIMVGVNESDMILDALKKSGGNKAKAARLLGIDRKTLYRKMERLHLVDLPF